MKSANELAIYFYIHTNKWRKEATERGVILVMGRVYDYA